MERIELGGSGVSITRVVFGAMATRDNSRERQRENLHAALEAGVTAIDTAPLYDFGVSERLVGEETAGRRDAVQILTKVGLRWDGNHGRVLFRGPGTDGVMRTVRCDSRPLAVRRDVEESLARLGTDVLDLVQVHRPDEDTPIADTMGELLRLRQEGKLRAIGVSNYSAEQVRLAQHALGEVRLASHQLHYSLLERSAERELGALAAQLGHRILAYSPLERGLLGGREPERAPRDLRDALATLRATAARCDISPAQAALAWLLAQPRVGGVIVGAGTPEQARDAAGAGAIALEPADLAALDRAFAGVRAPHRSRPGLARRALRKLRRVGTRARGLLR